MLVSTGAIGKCSGRRQIGVGSRRSRSWARPGAGPGELRAAAPQPAIPIRSDDVPMFAYPLPLGDPDPSRRSSLRRTAEHTDFDRDLMPAFRGFIPAISRRYVKSLYSSVKGLFSNFSNPLFRRCLHPRISIEIATSADRAAGPEIEAFRHQRISEERPAFRLTRTRTRDYRVKETVGVA